MPNKKSKPSKGNLNFRFQLLMNLFFRKRSQEGSWSWKEEGGASQRETRLVFNKNGDWRYNQSRSRDYIWYIKIHCFMQNIYFGAFFEKPVYSWQHYIPVFLLLFARCWILSVPLQLYLLNPYHINPFFSAHQAPPPSGAKQATPPPPGVNNALWYFSKFLPNLWFLITNILSIVYPLLPDNSDLEYSRSRVQIQAPPAPTPAAPAPAQPRRKPNPLETSFNFSFRLRLRPRVLLLNVFLHQSDIVLLVPSIVKIFYEFFISTTLFYLFKLPRLSTCVWISIQFLYLLSLCLSDESTEEYATPFFSR